MIFVVLALALMALYFRTWKMSVAAIAAMLFTIVITAGVYSLVGFEITPSAVIGFLTVLSYSLYDSVVVFDKVRENTAGLVGGSAPEERRKRTFGEQVNLAVNQTLVRSINTSVVGILPVGSILFIGAYLLGAGTLKDLSLSLFVGIIVGTLATLFRTETRLLARSRERAAQPGRRPGHAAGAARFHRWEHAWACWPPAPGCTPLPRRVC